MVGKNPIYNIPKSYRASFYSKGLFFNCNIWSLGPLNYQYKNKHMIYNKKFSSNVTAAILKSTTENPGRWEGPNYVKKNGLRSKLGT